MQRLAVINIVGLSKSLIGPHTPALSAFAQSQGIQSFAPEFPAVTCTAQSSMLTGAPVSTHGIVGNGWYDRESAEVRFWKQSNHIVHGEKVWETLRRKTPAFTCAKLFWWYNMHSTADWSITPRPLYPADGRKVFDIHTQPMSMREEIKAALGEFPFPAFWGPRAGIASSQWIAQSARWVEEKHSPSLSLVYLPHLDYALQKDGPGTANIPDELEAIDRVFDSLRSYYESRSVKVMVVSEYGISPVSTPIHINRELRKHGWLSLKNELGHETLDCGGCRAFAIADHQIAHLYVREPELIEQVREVVSAMPGVERVVAARDLWPAGIATARAGDLVAIAKPDAWFTYYFWENDALAPDYARTIDIHRKPGYDPCELFIDPELAFPKLKVAGFLLKKKLGLRGLLDVIPLDADLVKGSHGRSDVCEGERPVALGATRSIHQASDIHAAIVAHFGH